MTTAGCIRIFEPPLPYGHDYDDLSLWVDRTGAVYDGLGPFEHRWTRRLRRRVRPHSVGWLR